MITNLVDSKFPGAAVSAKGCTVRTLIILRELGSIRRETVWIFSSLGVFRLRETSMCTKG